MLELGPAEGIEPVWRVVIVWAEYAIGPARQAMSANKGGGDRDPACD